MPTLSAASSGKWSDRCSRLAAFSWVSASRRAAASKKEGKKRKCGRTRSRLACAAVCGVFLGEKMRGFGRSSRPVWLQAFVFGAANAGNIGNGSLNEIAKNRFGRPCVRMVAVPKRAEAPGKRAQQALPYRLEVIGPLCTPIQRCKRRGDLSSFRHDDAQRRIKVCAVRAAAVIDEHDYAKVKRPRESCVRYGVGRSPPTLHVRCREDIYPSSIHLCLLPVVPRIQCLIDITQDPFDLVLAMSHELNAPAPIAAAALAGDINRADDHTMNGDSDISKVRPIELDEKHRESAEHVEDANKHEDEPATGVFGTRKRRAVALDEAAEFLARMGDNRRPITAEEDKAVLKKIDWHLMPVMILIYWAQFFDKQTLSFASVFGIQKDANLHGKEYSWLGSVVYLAWYLALPISSYLLVRLRMSHIVPTLVTAWGIILACMAAAHNFPGLLVARFFLGAVESIIAPAFVLIGQIFYKRSEQPTRIMVWSVGIRCKHFFKF